MKKPLSIAVVGAASAVGMERTLSLYEATRKPRASAIQAKSSTNTWMRTDADPGWVYGYDAWSAPLGESPARVAE
jgi:6-hydroxynicotinate 3-monooxygenase